MAYGRDALRAPPPRLYAGMHLPRAVLEAVCSCWMNSGSPADCVMPVVYGVADRHIRGTSQ
jgi:hypothetical protein